MNNPKPAVAAIALGVLAAAIVYGALTWLGEIIGLEPRPNRIEIRVGETILEVFEPDSVFVRQVAPGDSVQIYDLGPSVTH